MNERDGQLDWNFALQWLLALALGATWPLRQETTAAI